ncbi:MAG TPA: peptidylprolyl isomerase [Candidatus Binatia bacterium]|nr:peptidylprolyl isomerase [Candidatus Binatia bacterium]
MEVAAGCVATLEYTVRLAGGQVVDSTGGCGPMAVLVGSGTLFPALEERLAGMQAGETREFTIPAADAFGEWRPELVREIPRERLPPDLALEIGAEYRLKAAGHRPLRFRLLEIGAGTVRADFNLPQAGQALHATVTVVAVRAATPDEERRGRV